MFQSIIVAYTSQMRVILIRANLLTRIYSRDFVSMTIPTCEKQSKWILEGPTRNPDTLAFLECTPTRQWLPACDWIRTFKDMILKREEYPGGPARHLNATRQKLSRDNFWDNFCPSIVAQMPSPRGQFCKEEKSPLLRGETVWEAF